MNPTKLWTHVPGTSVANKDLAYVMGSYTACAAFRTDWDHKGNLKTMVLWYRVTGPKMETSVADLGVAKNVVLRHMGRSV